MFYRTHCNTYMLTSTKILNLFIEQFQSRHGSLPEKVLVHPAAAVVLAARQSLAPTWHGVPVTIQEMPARGTSDPVNLGVVIDGDDLVAVDI